MVGTRSQGSDDPEPHLRRPGCCASRCSCGCSGRPDPARRGAAALLAVLGATDWVDGWIARHFDQGSELGKILDPTADRVLLVAAAVALLHEGLGDRRST